MKKNGLAKELNLAICYLAKASLPMRPSIRFVCKITIYMFTQSEQINKSSLFEKKRIGEGVEPCNMPLKTSLPMRPSIRFNCKITIYMFSQSEQKELFYFLLHQLARYLRRGYVSILTSSASYSLRKSPLVIVIS